jgi:ketosteroid isomerase-like protein
MAAERAPEIEQLVRDLLRGYQEGDVELISRHTSNDPAAISVGSDAGEVMRGYDEIVGLLRGEMEHRTPESPRLTADEIDAYREGDVAWATMLGAYATGEGAAIPARGSAVFHREDGDWKMVAWVFSFAVPNAVLEPDSQVLEQLAVATV